MTLTLSDLKFARLTEFMRLLKSCGSIPLTMGLCMGAGGGGGTMGAGDIGAGGVAGECGGGAGFAGPGFG